MISSDPPPAADGAVRRAAEAIARAEALLVTAGAGMGVDSGLPDFRGPEGFWRAYPAYRSLDFNFMDLADPAHFQRDSALAWGFYGHRLHLYQKTQPHAGFAILQRWAGRMPAGARVFTSNVDGQFQRAGFDEAQVAEVHGSIHHAQCLQDCGAGIFPADGFRVDVDETTMRARGELPRCPRCGGLARPNILMFGDSGWDPARSEVQKGRLADWLRALGRRPLAVVELGAGSAISTVRRFSEGAARTHGTCLVRINLRESDVPAGQIGLPLRALEGLEAVDAELPLTPPAA